MSGGNVPFNIALGRVAQQSLLPASNDAIVVILLKSSGLQADATLRDHDDLAALLAAGNAESDATNYVRKTFSSGVTVTVNDTTESVAVDLATDPVWTALGGATNNTLGKILFCYDPDTTVAGAHNANLIPLVAASFDVTTDGTDLTAAVADFFRAS